MPVWIADIEKESVAYAVPPRSPFHVGEIAASRHHVAHVQDVERRGGPYAYVMQPRAASIGEGDVVHIALAVHPNRPQQRVGIVGFGVLSEAEADLMKEVVARLDVRRETIDMVNALDARALVGGVALQHAFALVHAEIKIERGAVRIDCA